MIKKNLTKPSSLLPVLLTLLALLAALTGRAQSPFFQAVTNLNPVAYWPLQETVAPPAADVEANLGSLGAVGDAYYSSTNVVKGVSGIPSGDNDTCVNMQNGLNGSFLAVPLTDNRVALSGPFTVEAWIYPTNNSTSTILAQTGGSGSGGPGLNGGANAAGWSLNFGYVPSLNAQLGAAVSFHIYNGAGSTGGAETTFVVQNYSVASWYHIVGVFDGVNAVLYVNGVTNYPVIPSIPLTGTQARDTWDPLTIGCGRGLNNNRFGGYIDEVAIYDYALSGSRISTHFNTGVSGGGGYPSAVQADNPLMYWRMDAGAYTVPAASAYPAALNYGTGVNINALYLSGTTPGVPGPGYSGFGTQSYACAFNGIGTDSTNAIPLFTNGVPYATNTLAETGLIVTNTLSGMNLVTNSMSFMAWFKLNPSDNHRGVLVGHSDAGWRTSISGGAVTASTGKGSSDVAGPLNYNDGNWHFAVIVYTNSYVRLNTTNWLATNYIYVDGLLVATQPMTNGLVSAGTYTNISIGVAPDHVRTGNANNYDNQVLPGSIAHVAYFTNALSYSQVVNLYTNAVGAAFIPPVITGQPITGRTNSPGTGANGSGPGSYIFFGVTAVGATSYQWYFNPSASYGGATPLPEGSKYLAVTSNNLTVTNLVDSDSGYYFVVAANNYGSVTSSLASFKVINEPYVLAQAPAGGTLQLYQGQNYTLSVTANGESPFLYQWVTNGVPDTTAGTGSAYTLANVQQSMSGSTYQLLFTNSFGSGSSAPVTLSVTPLPPALTNAAFGSNVLALSPSGYWPMHEMAPAALGDVETNLGTLGSLANGYYADWAQPGSNIVHQIPGALANDSDPAVLFNNVPNSGTPGYIMIPRTLSGTTLTAPLTIEAWAKPLNVGFGDIVSEGGFGANQSSLRYGFRLCWGGGGVGGGLNSDFQVYIGIGTSANPGFPATVGANLPIGQWYHIALVTPDGTNWTLYVNGSAHNTFSSAMATDLGDPISIGTGLWQSSGPARGFQGDIDEVAIYPIALQASDVQTHYNDGQYGSAGQYKADVLSLNPLIYMRMNGPAYTPPPQSLWPILTNYGTVSGNGLYSAAATPGSVTGPNASGIAGKAVLPGNGASTYADAGNSSAFNPGPTTPFSFGAWFRGNPTDQRTSSTIIGHSDNSYRAALNATGKLQVHVSSNDMISATTYNDGNWHQFVVTCSGTNVTYTSTNTGVYSISTLYVDGAVLAQTNGFAMPGAAGVNLLIGDDPQYTNNLIGMGRSFAGQICEAAFWNGQMLSAQQVANLFNASGQLPIITKQPVMASANANAAFTNSVTVAYGSLPYAYQWYRDNQPLPLAGQTNLPTGATNANLIINPIKSSDASSDYYVVISNNGGSVTSAVVALTVYTQPVFTNEPILVTLTNNVVIFAGATPTFNVSTIGAQPIYYQWFTNGVAATAGTIGLTNYTLPAIQLGGLGVTNFYCVATNFVGKVTNTPVGITGLPAPTAPYPVAVMADHPIGYWRLDEPDDTLSDGNAGQIVHDFWGGKDGIYTNTVLGGSGYSVNTDSAETAAGFGLNQFQDSDGYGIGGVDFSAPSNSSFSVEAWVDGYPQNKDAGIVSKGYGNGGEQFNLDTGSDTLATHGFRFLLRDAAGNSHGASSAIAPSLGAWYHLVGVCDESNGMVTLYVNGAPAASSSISTLAGILPTARKMIIGSRPSNATTNDNDYQFAGYVDDVAVYNYALSPMQVGTHYAQAGVPPNFTQAPAAAITTNGFATLVLPAIVVGTPPISYTWQDQGAGTNLASGSTNGPLLTASLNIPSVPLNWNGDTLQLTVNNGYGSTNITVALTVFTNAPQFTVNLPAQVTVPSGKPYTYSAGLSGPQPYAYQWYNLSAPIPGATNSAYSLTAGNPGSTTYFLVVTNLFGAVTSTVSTFTSVAPPGSYPYATTVLGLNPVGYWPLQETAAPAAATMETNYGTLGALGNAYYACTNAAIVNFGVTGALIGDADSAAGFGIGQISYAFVPRVSPLLTIQAPFSLEVWVNTSNTTYGVMIGEGGGTGLNGNASFGGVQTGFGAQQAQMQYYTGGNNTYNQFNSPASYGPGTWYHVVSTYDGVNSATYVNGVQMDTGSTPNTSDTWSPLCIANGKWGSGANGPARQLSGQLDEVAIYTNVLSPGRIAAHYNSGVDPTDYGPYKPAVLADQPLLYYRMDCAGFTNPPAVDCPMAVNYGSAPVNGIYLPATVPGGLPGPTNSVMGPDSVAAIINGNLSCIDAGLDPAFTPSGSQPFTALTWFRTYPADGRLQAIMSHGTNWALNLDGTTGQVGWVLNNGNQVNSGAILNDGNWHFVAGVYDGTRSYLYVDGALANSIAISGSLGSETNARVYLGGNADYTLVGNNQRFLAGALSQAALFTNALTAAQIQSIYGSVPQTPTISIAPSGNSIVITYTGTLRSSTNVAGPYNPVAGATSPYTVSPNGPALFYRASVP